MATFVLKLIWSSFIVEINRDMNGMATLHSISDRYNHRVEINPKQEGYGN